MTTTTLPSGTGVVSSYRVADGLGSTMAIVDSSGAVQKGYTYDVYGKPTATGSLTNEFDFAGQQTDLTGLQYLRARYMDPETGTFLSREPMAVAPGWKGNGTSYAAANPAKYLDASGLYPIDSDGCHADHSDPSCERGISLEWDAICGGLYYYTYEHCRASVLVQDVRDRSSW